MKKNMRFVLLILFCFLLLGCDAGVEIVGIEIHSYPDQRLYVTSVDTELNLSGGEIYFLLRYGGRSWYSYSMYYDAITITHDIDFNKPGIYVVTLSRHRGVTQFEIEVVNPEDLP